MLENPRSAVGNPTSALGPQGSSFGPSSLAPIGIHHLLPSNSTTVKGALRPGARTGHATLYGSYERPRRFVRVKGKVFPYSLPSVGPGADPGVQAVSPQVT